MKESDFLKKCLDLIEDKVPWGPRKYWTTYNFSRLSQDVKAASGITLSTRTMRRLSNNYKSYKPQTATKDALAIYLGFKDWEDFRTGVTDHNSKGIQKKSSHRGLAQFLTDAVKSVWMYVFLYWSRDCGSKNFKRNEKAIKHRAP